MRLKQRSPISYRLAITGALLGGIAPSFAQNSPKLDKLEKENQELRMRLDSLEQVAKKEGLLGSTGASMPVKALSSTTLSGFVSASYFYDTSNPPGGTSPGYLWNRKSDSFALNKVKLTLASPPVERSGDKYDVAYRTSLIFGQDAAIVNSSSSTVGFENLREAYIEMNVPIGTGLNVRAGELISLLNYESGDGGAANDNYSQGYQWFYTGNGPAAGAQVGYTFTDWLDVKVRLQNGMYAGPVDNNNSKTIVVALGIKPCEPVWMSIVGFTGRENNSISVFQGISLLGGAKFAENWSVGTELDYFTFKISGHTSPVWSTGAWLSYAFTPKVGLAVRGEFLSDRDGVNASGDPLGFPLNSGQDLTSVALTLNYKPLPQIKIQPEIRYDHTSLDKGYGKQYDRFLIGVGVSYLF
ncbi:MAG: hypothetical protein EXS36_11235 [Pedosphaera sp.]|nr:hypothetical protein [Pedosphaera sp.]